MRRRDGYPDLRAPSRRGIVAQQHPRSLILIHFVVCQGVECLSPAFCFFIAKELAQMGIVEVGTIVGDKPAHQQLAAAQADYARI